MHKLTSFSLVPKAPRGFVLAKDESKPVPLVERISTHRQKFYAEVGKPHRVFNPSRHPYHPVPGRRETLARLAEQRAQERKQLITEYQEKQAKLRLELRLTTPPPPLIDRIDTSTPPTQYFELPPNIDFRTNTQVHRIRDFKRKFEGTRKHLEGVFTLRPDLAGKLSRETSQLILEYDTRLQQLSQNLESDVEGKHLTTSQWKRIDRDLKKASTVRISQLRKNYKEICEALVEKCGKDWLYIGTD